MTYYKLSYATFLLVSCTVTNSFIYADAQQQSNLGLTVNKRDFTIQIGNNDSFVVYPNVPLEQDVSITLVKQHEELIDLEPIEFLFSQTVINQTVVITGLRPGRLEVTSISQPNKTWITDDLFVRITIAHSQVLVYVSLGVGWLYFTVWTISFYPQIYDNWKRKSVVGLNFDLISFNLTGFVVYNAFNCGLYWIRPIEDQYFARYPRGVNPVLLNDVVFSLHSIFAAVLTGWQCLIYERGKQRVSTLARCILIFYATLIMIVIGLASCNVIEWLTFLYWCSYVKLSITLFASLPQAIMNYRRKSTEGWSIGNIILDLLGGVLSMLQMIFNAYNYNDWVSIFGDPTKFGMGLFSIFFDSFFMLQHYVFYRHARESPNSEKQSLDNGQNAGAPNYTLKE